MGSARTAQLIAATWLIGLGLVFLIQQAARIPWSQAWPLFVILAGIASVIGRLLRPAWGQHGLARVWSYTWPVVWILIGLVLLASTTGRLEAPAELIERWWPVAAIALGIWFVIGALVPLGSAPVEDLAIPLAGVSEAHVRIRFGAGELTIGPASPGNLVDGRFGGGVEYRATAPGTLELSQDTSRGQPWLDHRSVWTMGVTTEVPLDVRVDGGASKMTMDLGPTRVRLLELHTGASDTRVRLPRAAGRTLFRAQTGAASLTIEVPTGVAARIRTRMAFGSSQIEQARFPRSGDGYASPDFETATNRVEIDLTGGVGSVRVVDGS